MSSSKKKADFADRLQDVLDLGNLRVSDLARLFERPHSTVYGWLTRGMKPSGGPADVERIYARLKKLEKWQISIPPGLPLPQRAAFVDRLRQSLSMPE